MEINTSFLHSTVGSSSSNFTDTFELPVDCGLLGVQEQVKGGIPVGPAELLLEGAALEELGTSSLEEEELNSGSSPSSLEEELNSGSSSSLDELNIEINTISHSGSNSNSSKVGTLLHF
jgi:hypothetical protein